jgi:ribosomal protein S18 acetylase RimI-like enzyme
MKVFEVTEYQDSVLHTVNRLLPQLSDSAVSLSKDDLQKIISSGSSKLLIAEENNQISGILTLVVFKIPTGTRAWIEDVVVDSDARGKGVAKLLIEHAIIIAKECGAKKIDLTSHTSRKTANSLYKKTGFEIRETNVYRFKEL